MPMKPSTYLYAKHLGTGLAVLAIMLCTACGTKIIRGESPLVRMTELSHQDSSITLQLSMRNVNGVPLDIQSIDFSLSVDDEELFTYQGPAETNIVANGTETWSVEVEESQSSRDLLNTLENGEVKSLPYSLKGSVDSSDDSSLRFKHEGHLYPLPGRPGHFR
jgi:LEA14-like dessication related protein